MIVVLKRRKRIQLAHIPPLAAYRVIGKQLPLTTFQRFAVKILTIIFYIGSTLWVKLQSTVVTS